MKRFVLTGLCLLVLAACDKPAEPKPDDPASKNTTTPAPTAAPAPTAVTINEADLATPADFEETAEKAITAKNYKAELALLEADVAKE